MADVRAYYKNDVGYFDNPKVEPLVEFNPRAVLLHQRAIAYCAQHLTDGRFPMRLVMRKVFIEPCGSECGSQCEGQCPLGNLVQYGLVSVVDSRTALVHDYLEHNRSADSVKNAKVAGQKGAAVRWGKDSDADRNAVGNAVGNANANSQRERKRESSKGTANANTRSKPSRAIPDDWKPSDAHQQYATENSLDLSSEAFRFRNHAIANDRRVVRWDAAFSNWLSKATPSQTAKRGQQPEGW